MLGAASVTPSCSGLANHLVPPGDTVETLLPAWCNWDMPQSMILMLAGPSSTMFCGLMSRWMMPLAAAACSPAST
nr:hypothetical protein [Nonomuraea aurantiaca]